MRTKPVRIVGLTGLPGVGKGTFVNLLTEDLDRRGLTSKYYSLSDELRAEVRRQGASVERPVLREAANILRARYGNGILADLVIRGIKGDAGVGVPHAAIVDAIRNPGEVEELRSTFGGAFILVALEAPEAVLVDRIARRARLDESQAVIERVDAAREMIQSEAGKGEEAHGHNISACIAMAELRLANDGTIDKLRRDVRAFVDREFVSKVPTPDAENRPAQAFPIQLTEYFGMSEPERAAYLERLHHDAVDLPADFYLGALGRETALIARWHLIRGLGLTRSQDAISPLITVCKDSDHEFDDTSLHAIAAWSLGVVGEASVPFLLAELVVAEDEEVKRCIADALGETRSPRAITALVWLFRDGPWNVKLWSALSLSKIGLPAIDAVNELLGRTEPFQERALLIDAVVSVEGSASSSFLRKLMTEGSDEEKAFVSARYGDRIA